jgi:hypothetical protein
MRVRLPVSCLLGNPGPGLSSSIRVRRAPARRPPASLGRSGLSGSPPLAAPGPLSLLPIVTTAVSRGQSTGCQRRPSPHPGRPPPPSCKSGSESLSSHGGQLSGYEPQQGVRTCPQYHRAAGGRVAGHGSSPAWPGCLRRPGPPRLTQSRAGHLTRSRAKPLTGSQNLRRLP